MKIRRIILGLIVLFAIAILSAGFFALRAKRSDVDNADRLLLLVPDGTNLSDPRVTVWLDAAAEQGLHVLPMYDSDYLNPLTGNPACAGLILPDSIHKRASDVFVEAIRNYVARGGNLMLVYDAATQSLGGLYPADHVPLSDVAGVKYALYSSLAANTIEWDSVSGTILAMDQLGVPPGKYYPLGAPGIPAAAGTETTELRRYQYGDLKYPSFVTAGAYDGQVLLHSRAGLVAGHGRYGRGSVLFVNLPLGFLAGNTDGLPLHSFLTFFATRVLSLPYLMQVPDGVGGLVLDWHVDYAGAVEPLEEMNTWTIAQQGPYSMDFTAGPDDDAVGDHKGLDLLHNSVAQELIRRYEQSGYAIGSHGGWLHNYFATHVNDADAAEMQKYLELNKDAIADVTGKPVLEYSAPDGNQPQWVTEWLEKHGVIAYYFTGNTGMGPTVGYRGGEPAGTKIWAFPILHLDRAATFEEMPKYGYPDALIAQWLDAATDFVANHREVRLIYFHPPGILQYHTVLDGWMDKTAQLKVAGTFRWYTMPEIAEFLNVRKTVQWTIRDAGSLATLDVTDQSTLDHQTLRLPKGVFAEPRVVSGNAQVVSAGDSWFVTAGPGTRLTVESRLVNK